MLSGHSASQDRVTARCLVRGIAILHSPRGGDTHTKAAADKPAAAKRWRVPAQLPAGTFDNRSAKTVLALPGCLTALAFSRFTGLPTTISATMPMP